MKFLDYLGCDSKPILQNPHTPVTGHVRLYDLFVLLYIWYT